jgi:hypothetical protein
MQRFTPSPLCFLCLPSLQSFHTHSCFDFSSVIRLLAQQQDSTTTLRQSLSEREQEFMAREQQLLAHSKELAHENLGLYEFKASREKLWADLQRFQQTLEQNELQYKAELANCERKWSQISKK